MAQTSPVTLELEHYTGPGAFLSPIMDFEPKVCLASGNATLQRNVTRALVSIGYEVDPWPFADRSANDSLPPPRDLYVVDAEDPLCEPFLLRLKQARPDAVVLALTRDLATPTLLGMLLEHGVSNLIACHGGSASPEAMIDESELITTCHKVFTGDIFGLEKCLGAHGVKVHRLRIHSSVDKQIGLGSLIQFLDRLCCHRRIASDVINVADELLTNALFNAPTDALGEPRHDKVERSTLVTLNPNEEIILCFACDGRHVAISVSDPFGRLKRSTILNYLRPYLLGRTAPIEYKAAGAGVGLGMVMNSITQLIFNIQPYHRTEVIASFYIRSSPRAYHYSGRSLNIFTID